MGRFREWLKEQGPSWLRGTNGRALSGELGGELDLQQDRLLNGLLARFPLKGNIDANGIYGLPPADALDQQGEDRDMRRGPSETDAAYGARLWGAWDFKPYLGSHYGILRSLQIAGYEDMVIVQDNGRYTELAADPANPDDVTFGNLMTCITRGTVPGWTFDALDGAFYSQFAIVFTADAANLQSASGQAILTDIVNTWKPSNKRYDGAVVILAGGLWGWPLGQAWGDGGDVWGGDSARYIPGDGSAAFEVP